MAEKEEKVENAGINTSQFRAKFPYNLSPFASHKEFYQYHWK
jgi:hypothetical protein